MTGSVPGRPSETGSVCVFGGRPNSVPHAENILLSVRSWTWTSRPMTIARNPSTAASESRHRRARPVPSRRLPAAADAIASPARRRGRSGAGLLGERPGPGVAGRSAGPTSVSPQGMLESRGCRRGWR